MNISFPFIFKIILSCLLLCLAWVIESLFMDDTFSIQATDQITKVEEPAAMTSSENADIISEPSEKFEIPNVPDNAEHHVVVPVRRLPFLFLFYNIGVYGGIFTSDEGTSVSWIIIICCRILCL